jgi:hypothetical protein
MVNKKTLLVESSRDSAPPGYMYLKFIDFRINRFLVEEYFIVIILDD